MAESKKTEKTAATDTPKGYSRVASPTGAVTLVPDEIKKPLLDSGYTEAK